MNPTFHVALTFPVILSPVLGYLFFFAFMHACVFTCVGGGQRTTLGASPPQMPFTFFSPKLFHWPRMSLIRLALLARRGLRIPLSLPLQQWVYKPTPPHGAFYMGAGNQNQVPKLAQEVFYQHIHLPWPLEQIFECSDSSRPNQAASHIESLLSSKVIGS